MSSSFPAARFPALPLSQQKRADGTLSTERVEAAQEPSDDVLIAKVQSGDHEALASLFRRYARLVWGIGKRIVRDQGEADDVLQDVFFLIYRKASVFDSSKGTVRSLIVHMAYQRAITRRNYLAARHSFASDEAGQRAETLTTKAVPSYDESIEAHFGRDRLQRALDDLSADQKRTLQLYFFEGHTLAEIGERLGQPLGNVKHHYYRGLEKLRKHIPEQAKGPKPQARERATG
jgi:RNA polymerase sigma-70 factor, ECF subfamily